LEYRLAQELNTREIIANVYPLLVGDLKTDANGDTLWTRTYNPSDGIDLIRNMLVLPNGDIVMVGFGQGENSTTQDGWILRVDSMGCLVEGCGAVGVEEFEEEANYFQAYPNPFAQTTTIAYDLGRDCKLGCQLRLYDVQGRIILQQLLESENGKGTEVLDLSNYGQGVYYCSLYGEGQLLQTQKLILLK
jgi:hypothetical protein